MKRQTVLALPELAEVLMSQGRMARWMAGKIKVSESHLSRVLSGQRGLRQDKAERICLILGVEMADVFQVSISSKGDTDE
jgi:transcriptional regulator with XRE-family HTH domain